MSTDVYREIGRKIRTLRSSAGLSQNALAKRLKTSANTISRWEAGSYKPTIPDLQLVGKVLGVPITYFLPSGTESASISALVSAAKDLSDADLKEVIRYALYRRASSEIKF